MTLIEEPQIVALAADLGAHVRHVATPGGSTFYGLPIGSPITKALEEAIKAEKAAQGIKPPADALSQTPVATPQLDQFKSQGFQTSNLGINKHLDPNGVDEAALDAMSPGAGLHVVYKDGTHRVMTKNPDGSWSVDGFTESVGSAALAFALPSSDNIVQTNEGDPKAKVLSTPKVGDDIESAEHLAKVPDGDTVQHKVTKAIYEKQGDTLKSTTGGYNKNISSLKKVFAQKNLKYHGKGKGTAAADTSDPEGPAHEPGTVLTHEQVGALKPGHQSKYSGSGATYTANGDGTHTNEASGATIDHDAFANAANKGKISYVGKKKPEETDGAAAGKPGDAAGAGAVADQSGAGNAGAGGSGPVSEGVGPAEHDEGSGHPGGDAAGLELKFGGTVTVKQEVPQSEGIKALAAKGKPTPPFYELDSATSAGAFHSAIQALADHSTHASSVYVYSEDEYKGMRLFLNKEGTAGFALHGDDVVSVFSHPDPTSKGSGRAIIQTAVDMGGKRLDAFDTMLPNLYAGAGFVAVARTKWNDNYAPEGWDTEAFKQYNGGKPDVVFMALAKDGKGHYSTGDGVTIENYDDGAKVQEQFLSTGAIKAPKSHPLDKGTALKVGESITSLDQIKALPVNAEVKVRDSVNNVSYDYNKIEDDNWGTDDADGINDADWSSTVGPTAGEGMSAVVSKLPPTDEEKAAKTAATSAKAAATKQANKDAADAAAAQQAADDAKAAVAAQVAKATEKPKSEEDAAASDAAATVAAPVIDVDDLVQAPEQSHLSLNMKDWSVGYTKTAPDEWTRDDDPTYTTESAHFKSFVKKGQVSIKGPDSKVGGNANDLFNGQPVVAPAQPAEPDTKSPSISVVPGEPLLSHDAVAESLTTLQAAPGFQVAYGLKGTPLADSAKALTSQAQAAYPGIASKPAVLAFLKAKLGIEDAKADDTDSPIIHIGAATPKSTGVQGLNGGDYTKADIESAIKILQNHTGKIFKSELGKQGSPLAALNPVSMIDAEKDKDANKQKFIALLQKALDDHAAKQPAASGPKVGDALTMDTVKALPVGAVIKSKKSATATFTVTGPNAAVDGDGKPHEIDPDLNVFITAGNAYYASGPGPEVYAPKPGDKATSADVMGAAEGSSFSLQGEPYTKSNGTMAATDGTTTSVENFAHIADSEKSNVKWVNGGMKPLAADGFTANDDATTGVPATGEVTEQDIAAAPVAAPSVKKPVLVQIAPDAVNSLHAGQKMVFSNPAHDDTDPASWNTKQPNGTWTNDATGTEILPDLQQQMAQVMDGQPDQPTFKHVITPSEQIGYVAPMDTATPSNGMQLWVKSDAKDPNPIRFAYNSTTLHWENLADQDDWIGQTSFQKLVKNGLVTWDKPDSDAVATPAVSSPDLSAVKTGKVAANDLYDVPNLTTVWHKNYTGGFTKYTYHHLSDNWQDDSGFQRSTGWMQDRANDGELTWNDPSTAPEALAPAKVATALDVASASDGDVLYVHSDLSGNTASYKWDDYDSMWKNQDGSGDDLLNSEMKARANTGSVTFTMPGTTEGTAIGDLPPKKVFVAGDAVHSQDLPFLKAGDLVKAHADANVVIAKQNNGLFVNPDTGTVYAPPFVADMLGDHGSFFGHDDTKIFDQDYTGPEYVHEAQANLNAGYSQEDANAYTGDNAMAEPSGTVLIGTDGSFWTKSPNNNWLQSKGGQHTSTASNTPGNAFYKAVDDHQIQPYVKAGPPTSKYSIVPGKYSTGAGAAYMVVKADGSGVYVNSAGTVKKLTVEAVKKNLDAGMSNYGGMPDVVPDVTVAGPKTKIKDLADLPDGQYYNGLPNGDKTWVYEVAGDTAVIHKPMPAKVGGSATGDSVTQDWLDHAGTGAQFKHPYAGYDNQQIYVGYGLGENNSSYKTLTVPADEYTFTKQADGTWKDGKGNTVNPADQFAKTPGFQSNIWNYMVQSHGISDPVTVNKKKVNTLFAQGKLLDNEGNSVHPDGYDGNITILGWSGPVTGWLKAKAALDSSEPSAKAFKDAGVNVNAKLTKAYVSAHGVDWDDDAANDTGARWKVLSDLIGEKTAGVAVPVDANNDATALFKHNAQGQPIYPAELVNAPTNSTSEQTAFIKQASALFDGTIGEHPEWMDTYDKGYWINAFQKGNFGSLYTLDSQAAATHQSSLSKGYLHPGYPENASTLSLTWAPAVDGEKPAAEIIPGNWTKVPKYGNGIKPSIEEVQNYLIAAQMQHPTYLSAPEQRLWVQYHQKHDQQQVDMLSVTAENRKDSGLSELSPALVWTYDLKVPKTYDSMFEGTDKNPTEGWSTQAAADYYDDNKAKIPALVSLMQAADNDPNGYYAGSAENEKIAVVGYFQGIKDAAAAKALIPVYKKTTGHALGGSAHEVFEVSDQFGQKYFFKPAPSGDKYRSLVEHTGNLFGKLFGFSTTDSSLITLDGDYGNLQKDVGGSSSLLNYKYSTLSSDQIADIGMEHLLDHFLDNDDTKGDNAKILDNGHIVGIDKGRSFKHFGSWNSLAADESMNSNADTIYSHLYNAIRSGSFKKEDVDKAYLKVHKRAVKMQRVSDATITQMLADGTVGRQQWDIKYTIDGKPVGHNLQGLTAAVLDRKNKIVTDSDAMWAKVYKDAGLGDLPVPPKTRLVEDKPSGLDDPMLHEAVFKVDSHGKATSLGGGDFKDGSALVWSSYNDNNSPSFNGEGVLMPTAQQTLLGWLKAHTSSVSPSKADPTGMAAYDIFGDAFIEASKTISYHATNDPGQYNQQRINAYKAAVDKIIKDQNAWSATMVGNVDGGESFAFPSGQKVNMRNVDQYKLMLDYYGAQIPGIENAMATTGKAPKIVHYTPTALGNPPAIYLNKAKGLKVTKLANGDFIYNDGTSLSTVTSAQMKAPGSSPDAIAVADAMTGGTGWQALSDKPVEQATDVKVTFGKTHDRAGFIQDGQLHYKNGALPEGAPGSEYQVELPTGEKIWFRNEDTGAVLSQQGRLSFQLPDVKDEDASQASMERVTQQLHAMGISADEATPDDAERTYWRSMYQTLAKRSHTSGDAYSKAWNDLKTKQTELGSSTGYDAAFLEALSKSYPNTADENMFWRALYAKYFGKEKIDNFIAADGYLPHYEHQDYTQPGIGTGKPRFRRFDISDEDARATGKWIASSNTNSNGNILRAAKSGGMLSTEERLRYYGEVIKGMSSVPSQGKNDQEQGSSGGIFTRIASEGSVSNSNDWQYIYNPGALGWTDTYAFSGDNYGAIANQKSGSPSSLKGMLDIAGGGNEVMLPNSASLLDGDLEIIVFENANDRQEAIDFLKKRGIDSIRGVPVEDRLIMRKMAPESVKKVKEAWKNWQPTPA